MRTAAGSAPHGSAASATSPRSTRATVRPGRQRESPSPAAAPPIATAAVAPAPSATASAAVAAAPIAASSHDSRLTGPQRTSTRTAAGGGGGGPGGDGARPAPPPRAGGPHPSVEPRQPADGAAADEHEHSGGDGGERAGGDRARLCLARQRGGAGGCQRECEHRSRARHGPPGDDRARARDGPRREEGARDRVHEHSGILAYGTPRIHSCGRE